jgi:hypothetical protein
MNFKGMEKSSRGLNVGTILWHLPGWTEENHEKTQDMVAGFRAEI